MSAPNLDKLLYTFVMGLEEFEKQLAEEQADRTCRERNKRKRSQSPHERRDRHNRNRHHHSSHHHSRHHDSDVERPDYAQLSRSTSKRDDGAHKDRRHQRERHHSRSPSPRGASDKHVSTHSERKDRPQRMSWMESPASDEIERVRSKRPKTPPGYFRKAAHSGAQPIPQDESDEPHTVLSSSEPSRTAGISTTTLPPGFSKPAVSSSSSQLMPPPGFYKPNSDLGLNLPSGHEVDYSFGDAGSEWRMKKLNGVYREAREANTSVEDIAMKRYGSLQDFDDAREEETEMDRRRMYGSEYVGKDKPSGDLYEERKHKASMETSTLDESTLHKMKADMLHAKSSNAPDAVDLEARYNAAIVSAASARQPNTVVINRMENRMLAGGRTGEVKELTGKRARERGLVEENEDMSIEDMVRQERRTRGQPGGDGLLFAERIAKDGKFDDDLEYMDDNAEKLAKSVQKSDINLRNTSISEYHKMKRILDSCPLCTHEDTSSPPVAPVVSLGTRTFLTLPTIPEVTPYGLCASIVPTQHRLNLLECDDDEWEEIRNFMKSLTRFYYNLKPKRSVIFYENAAHEGRKRHASLEAVPLPMSIAETIPQYFKEAIMSADEEWTQHKKLIDTLKNSERPGFGKQAFRKSMVSELPYFHVWFRIDGGLGHVVEDPRRWPRGDLFAREIIGGILDVAPDKIRKQGRWRRGDPEMQDRVGDFRKLWDKWDWTKAIMDPP